MDTLTLPSNALKLPLGQTKPLYYNTPNPNPPLYIPNPNSLTQP